MLLPKCELLRFQEKEEVILDFKSEQFDPAVIFPPTNISGGGGVCDIHSRQNSTQAKLMEEIDLKS